MREVRPLRSTSITSLPRYYEPVRLPTWSTRRYGFRRPVAARGTTPGLPGPLTVLSTRALPSHPGRLDGCVCSFLPHRWQASASPEAWPSSSSCVEVESGSLALGSRLRCPDRSGRSLLRRGTGPFRAISYPPTPDRSYMVNEQFTWPTPFSQQEPPGLAWRNRRARGKG